MFDICSVRNVFIFSNRFRCSNVHSKIFCFLRILSNGLRYCCVYRYFYLKQLMFQKYLGFFVFDLIWSFNLPSIRIFNGMIVLLSLNDHKVFE